MKVRWLCSLMAVLLLHAVASAQQPGPGAAPNAPAGPPAAPTAPGVPAVQTQQAAPVTPAATTASPPAAPAAPATADKPAAAAVDAAAAEPENYDPNAPGDWEYKDADLQTVLSSLALRANLNLIVGDNVNGRVTVLLRGITARQALEVIAESKGLVVREENKIVKVLTRDAADMLPTFTKVFTLGYAKAAEVAVILQPNLTKQGRVTVDPRSNSLVLTDTQPSLEKVASLLTSLDTQTPQVQIEAKFIETTKVVGKGMGVDWSDTFTAHRISFGGVAATEGEGEDAGVGNFTWMKGLRPATPWSVSAAMLDFGQAQVILSFMNSDSDTELLASPRVVTMDNVRAKVAIANQIAIPQLEFNETTGSYQSKGFDWKEIGVILNVVPRVNKDGFITLEVSPEVSSPIGSSTIAGISVPTISTRTATTVVLIKSGNTLIIGGLIREDVADRYTKVPVVGDIPGLGSLFRSKSLSKTKRNLLVFLTPTLISPEARVNEAAAMAPLRDEIYTSDRFMPLDNAKPSPFKETWSRLKPSASANAPSQNFGPK